MSTRGEKRKKELESHALSGRVRHVFRVLHINWDLDFFLHEGAHR